MGWRELGKGESPAPPKWRELSEGEPPAPPKPREVEPVAESSKVVTPVDPVGLTPGIVGNLYYSMHPQDRPAVPYGIREGAAALPGLIDLVGMAADWAHNENEVDGDAPFTGELPERDPVTGWGLADRTRRLLDPTLPHPEWKPETPMQRGIAGATEAATTFAVPGAAGVGYMRAAPRAVNSLRATGSLGAAGRTYRAGATANMGTNAARLGGSNLAGSVAAQAAEAYADPEGSAGVWAPAIAAMVADPLSARGASMGGTAAARRMAAEVSPQAARHSIANRMPKAWNRMHGHWRSILKNRIDAEDVTLTDIIDARDHVHRVLFGQAEPITAKDIQRAIDAGDEDLAQTLRGRKRAYDIIMETLGEAKELRDAGIPRPTSRGWIGGSRDTVSGERLGHIAKTTSAVDDDFSRRSVDANELARQFYAGEAMAMRPSASGFDAQGTPVSVRGAFDEAAEARRAVAGDPWESGQIDDMLTRAGNVSTSSVRRVLNNVVSEMNLSQADADLIGIDGIMERVARYSDGGSIPARELHSVTRQLRNELEAATDLPADVRKFRTRAYRKMRDQLRRRMTPEDRSAFDEAMADYSDFKGTYEALTPSQRKGADIEALRQSAVADALSRVPNNAEDMTATVKALAKAPGTGAEVATQVRKVMGDDPARLAEVEQQIWRSLLGPVADTDTTAGSVFKAMRANDGAIDIEEPGKLVAMYRALAGDEKADAAEKLLERARQARYDDAGEMAKVSKTDSSSHTQLMAEDAMNGNVGGVIKRLMRATLGGEPSEDMVAAAMREALIDPAVLFDLLNVPSGSAYNAWKDRVRRRLGLASIREMGMKRSPREE